MDGVVAAVAMLLLGAGCGRVSYDELDTGDGQPVVLDCGPDGPDPALQLAYYDFEGDIATGVVDRSRDTALDTDCPTGICPYPAPGILGSAASLADDRYLRAIGSELPAGAFDDGFTVILFFYAESNAAPEDQTLFSQPLQVRAANSMQLVVTANLGAMTFITDNLDSRDHLNDYTGVPFRTWLHVAMVYQPSSGRKSLVFDGVETVAKTGVTVDHDDSDLLTGVDHDADKADYDNPFYGRIDELRVFTAALTPAEIDACRRWALDGGD